MCSDKAQLVNHAENALMAGNQAIAVLDLWLCVPAEGQQSEVNLVAAVHTLLCDALSHIKKITEAGHV